MGLPAEIPPDDRDWTFVLYEGCGECGFDPAYDVAATGSRLRAALPGYVAALGRSDARTRPAPTVWCATEYSCHVRDVCRLFAERLTLVLEQDDPQFAHWDQDVAAVDERYWAQDPLVVADELAEEAERTAAAFDAVTGGQWERTGRRSDGTVFTARALAVYFLHDVEHHLHDVDR